VPVPVPVSACPGCGLVLPDADRPQTERINASTACQVVHDRVSAFEVEHQPLARFRQLRVDAYGAQHAGPPTPSIRVAYGLVGLHLARPGPDWPRFEAAPRAAATIAEAARDGADAGSALTDRLFRGDEPFWRATDDYQP